jgi:hypothetical protein
MSDCHQLLAGKKFDTLQAKRNTYAKRARKHE